MFIESYSIQASSQRTYLSMETMTLTGKKEQVIAPPEEKGNNEDVKVSISDAVKEMYEKAKEDSDKILGEAAQAQAPMRLSNARTP